MNELSSSYICNVCSTDLIKLVDFGDGLLDWQLDSNALSLDGKGVFWLDPIAS